MVISYHDSGPFANGFATTRYSFYGQHGTPDVHIDGIIDVLGGIHSGTMYPTYRQAFDTRKLIPSTLDIGMSVSYDSVSRQGHLGIVLRNPTDNSVTGQLQVVLGERSIYYPWQGIDSLYTVERSMLPDASGESVTIPSHDSLVKTRDFTVDPAWAATHCDLIAFVQNNSTKEMIQAARTAVIPAPAIGYLKYEPVLPLPDSDVTFSVHLTNIGTGDATNVHATLTTADSFLTVLSGAADYGAIPRNGDGAPLSAFRIHVSHSCPDPHLAILNLSISSDNGYASVSSFPLNITATPGFSDDMENSDNGWTSYGTSDNWHRTDHRSHWGTHSWYCGVEGSWQYTNENDASLVTPFFTMGDSDRIAFYQWRASEATFDFCMVEIGNGSDFWQMLGNYSGASSDWELMNFPLPDWSHQTAQVRFRFLSDYNGTDEGWYVDDFAGGNLLGVGDQPKHVTRASRLEVEHNPISEHALLNYSVPVGKTAALAVFDAGGRRVATLAEGLTGSGHVRWNASDAVRSGMYFATLRVGSEMTTVRVTVVK